MPKGSDRQPHNACVISDPVVKELSLWDFLSERGKNMILRWVKDGRLSVRDRAALNQKFERLVQMDFKMAIDTKLLAGPIHKSQHIYKVKIHGQVMLRPMLCKGPINNQEEYTLSGGAVETGGRLPAGSVEKAQQNRGIVMNNPQRRCPHAQIPNRS